MIQLRNYQQRAVDSLRAAYARGASRPLLVLPTGGGKTVIFTYVAANSVAKGNRVLVLVHRKELLRQTSAALNRFGVTHGLIHPDYSPSYYHACQVASVQSLIRRVAKQPIPAPDLIIVDEAHHANAGMWRKIIDLYPKARVLGVTATPCRADGKGLGDVFDEMIVGASIADLIAQGYLVEPIVYAPTVPDLSQVEIRGGDYALDQLADAMDAKSITGDAIAHYRKHANGKPCVVFCVSREHAQHVAASFVKAGYRAASVDGEMPAEERDKLLSALGNGGIDVVTSCDLISEGTDIPAIGCAILLRPTESLGLYIQQVGRALRLAAGKEEAIILDHAGNCFRHGLPQEDRIWSLNGKAKRKKGEEEARIPVKQCPKCFAMHRPTLRQCPSCKYIHPVESREVKEVAGELERIEGTADPARKRKFTEITQVARTYEDLVKIGQDMKFRHPEGWARAIIRAREEKAARTKDACNLFE